MAREQIIKDIFTNRNETTLASFVVGITEFDQIDSTNISQIISLDASKLAKEGQAILETLEKDDTFPYRDMYRKMKWKLVCLVNIQDVLNGTIYSDGNPEIMGSRHYFYYESLHLLREYFYCGFNNYLSAAEHLLRTIVEFNIKQCYFDYICREQNSFKPLIEYFESGISPSSLSMANTYLPKINLAKPIKKKIQHLLKVLSSKSSHAYKPIDSIRGNGKLRHEYSIDSMFFWMSLNHSITVVLWSYFLLKPNLFNPKNVIRKFGFNYPMGVFISNFQYQSVVNSISKEDLEVFRGFAKQTQEYKDYEDFYNEQSDLTDKEILETWKDDEKVDLENGYIISVAKFRTMIEMLSSKSSIDIQVDVDESMESLLRQVADYSWWKKNYKRF